MIRFLRRWLCRSANSDRTNELRPLAPLSQLVEAADPGAELLAHIEARIDAECPPSTGGTEIWSRPQRRLGLLILVAVLSAAAGYFVRPERQRIIMRPTADANWGPLGSVTLHGPALRTFVRGKCAGQTHFIITLHPISVPELPTMSIPDTSLVEGEEKILMECIF